MKRTLMVPVLVAVFSLSACSIHPGSAAAVGSETIRAGQVDDVASALCAAQSNAGQTGQPQGLASRAARQGALSVLLNSMLSRQYGASKGLQPDQGQVSAALAANQQNIDSLPSDRREVFRQTLRGYAEGQLMLIQVGQSELVSRGTQNLTQQQALAEGTKLRDAWAQRHLRVSVDPRYGEFSHGALRPRAGSLSAAVSSSAADGSKAQPSSSWVSALPATQKCS